MWHDASLFDTRRCYSSLFINENVLCTHIVFELKTIIWLVMCLNMIGTLSAGQE